ncbi:heme/hemin ABC transporter substrate-binding protein [Microvirga guangxiensis]|uniref:Iron complex transport system substrate-binding protein n=1 Tax=Microvirga guangxiensis TaxID=549386 RepID=A0A1G5GA48_9HYPH|nr:ABC transporter substrate-binding protein [Microvirga guangxiensis]SCY47598.1 iron complex transport system substrate-binding protein [Microvirga guangxiensis]
MTLLSRRALLAAPALMLAARHAKAAPARRIVSVGGAVTEILYRLGQETEIVGVDATSLYPADALKTKANVGYIRALGAEGVLSLNPTLVLAAEGAGPPDALQLIAQAGITIVRVPDRPSADGIVERVKVIAQTLDMPERGAALIQEIERGFAELTDARARIKQPARALFVLSFQNGRPLVGGQGTTADAMLALAGATNAASSLNGWKPMSDEGVIAAAPEAIVMMSHGPGGAAQDPFTFPAFAATPAAVKRRLVVMDSLYLLGFGPRTPAAARELMAALHAEQIKAANP